MATVREYVGARYVPLFAEPLEWDKAKSYEPLTIVLYQGNSYTSRRYVPDNVDISNETFWALTGSYNAQIEQYRNEVRAFDGRITANANSISTLDARIDLGEAKLANACVSVKDCGAVGDGTADDTQAFILALQQAAANGTYVYVPAGDFKVTSQLAVTAPIIGAGVGKTVLIADNGFDVLVCGTQTSPAFGVKLEGFTLTRADKTWKNDGFAGIRVCAGSYSIDNVCSAYSAIAFKSESLPNYDNHDLYNTKDVREIRSCSAYGGYIGFMVVNQDSFMSNCTAGSFTLNCFELSGVTGSGFHAWAYGKHGFQFKGTCNISNAQIESDTATGNYKSCIYSETANANVVMNGVDIWGIYNQAAQYWDALIFFKNGAKLTANGVSIRYPFGANTDKVCPPLFIGQGGSSAQIIGTISEFDSLTGAYWVSGPAMVAMACSHDDYVKLATTAAKKTFLVDIGTKGCGVTTVTVP